MTPSFAPGDLVRARGREWVSLPAPRDGLLALRPLSGNEDDIVLLDPNLETDEPVESAHFELPDDPVPTVQPKAALLADALRLTLRRGAGPFRSAANIAFEPRPYQLVPLLMALRLSVPRLLIADDVGIGKTIEAGLILREFMDRGEVDAFSVLCPPHLVEQWTIELQSRFNIDAVAVTASSATRLERNLPVAQSLFNAYKFTVVSLDYIKAEKRREVFTSACPDFVIVDEAHTCVGTTHMGRQQRFALLKGLASDPERHLIMLTATPHSGDEEAFSRLLSLINPEFETLKFGDELYRRHLARHFVQRRRIDLVEGEWDEMRVFPKHETKETTYHLSKSQLDFQGAVLDYCLETVEKVDMRDWERRVAFWGTLALMRCVGSSPKAALRALLNRVENEDERLGSQLYDEDGDDGDAVDIEPSLGADPNLAQLIRQAEQLSKQKDPKFEALVDVLKPLLKKGANPVVFCRFIATAEHVRQGLRERFPELNVEKVTGELTPDGRRDRVSDMRMQDTQRILVATDCLSEGINLQQLFDAVIHYDLCWNPTRHQQREGRVDRFGQPAKLVRSVMMFSPDSAIDGAVLEVILRKAEDIKKATGVAVPLPEDHGPVTNALINSLILRRKDAKQLGLELHLQDGTRTMDTHWRDVEEKERRSRTRFAQNAMKPQRVVPEWKKAGKLVGSPDDARSFIGQAMSSFGIPLESQEPVLIAHVHALERSLCERLQQQGLTGSVRIASAEPAPSGTLLLTRMHPLIATLADALVEASLDPECLSDLGIGRVGAWPMSEVEQVTLTVLLRIRFKLTIHTKKERILLAEEAGLVALHEGTIVASGDDVRQLLNTPAAAGLAPKARDLKVEQLCRHLPELVNGPIAQFARERADELAKDHAKLRDAASGVSRASVKCVHPPDIIGLFVLLPWEG